MNNWKAIWNRREADERFLQSLEDPKAIWRELKRIDGFDVDLGDSADAYYNVLGPMPIGLISVLPMLAVAVGLTLHQMKREQ